jgi:hypothetical protein
VVALPAPFVHEGILLACLLACFPDPEFMMARSFRQFQQNRSAPKMQLSESLFAVGLLKARLTASGFGRA